MTSDVTRTEFDGSIQSLRREIQIMGGNLDKRLDQLIRLVEEMGKSTSEDSKAVATLRVEVNDLKEWRANTQILNRGLWVGLVVSFGAQLFQILLRK